MGQVLSHQQNYNFLVAFSGLNVLFRLPRKPTSPEDYLNLQTVKAGDSLFITQSLYINHKTCLK
jgi:hypothetical protein